MDKVTFFIPLQPVSWKAHGGYGRYSYNPRSKEREDFQRVALSLINKPTHFSGAINLQIVYSLGIPKYKSKKGIVLERHTKRPDLDNLNKFALDCLKGILFEDDSQVYHLTSCKYYADPVGTFITIYHMNDECVEKHIDLNNKNLKFTV